MVSLQKPKRTTSAAFREWLRPGGCVAKGSHCYGGLEFHHEKRKAAAGSDPFLGGSDFCGMWLCWHHHMLAQGRLAEFERDLGMGAWEWLFRQLYLYAMERGLLAFDGERADAGKADVRAAVSEALALVQEGKLAEARVRLEGAILLAAAKEANGA